MLDDGGRVPRAVGQLVSRAADELSTCACGAPAGPRARRASARRGRRRRAAPLRVDLCIGSTLTGRPNSACTPSLNATWSGVRSVMPGRPTEATSPSSSSRTSASRSVQGSCALGTYVVPRRRRTWAPHRAVRKSSSGVASRGRAHPHDDPARRARPEASQPGVVRHHGRPRGGSASAPSGTGAPIAADRGHRRALGRCPGSGRRRRAGQSRRPSRAGPWSRGRCRSRGSAGSAAEAHADHPERHQTRRRCGPRARPAGRRPAGTAPPPPGRRPSARTSGPATPASRSPGPAAAGPPG